MKINFIDMFKKQNDCNPCYTPKWSYYLSISIESGSAKVACRIQYSVLGNSYIPSGKSIRIPRVNSFFSSCLLRDKGFVVI